MVFPKHGIWAASLAPVLILAASVLSKDNGQIPGAGGIPAMAARGGANGDESCGKCHSDDPGEQNVATALTPGQRSLDLGQSISVTLQITGGPQFFQEGGFAAENTGGAFSAGSGSEIDSTGAFITHSHDMNRSWTFGYTAPTQAGVVQLYGVGLAADGDDAKSQGDEWALHGSDTTAFFGTPVHLYANATGNTKGSGTSCVGPFGNYPVLGSKESPTAGNQQYGLELHGASTAAPITLFLGTPAAAIPLDLFGFEGCSLQVSPLITLAVGATSGTPGSKMADGTATVPLPLPATTPVGVTLSGQIAIVAPVSGRSAPVTFTNALNFTIM